MWLLKSRVDASVPPALRLTRPTVVNKTWTVIKTTVPDRLPLQQAKFIDKDLLCNNTDTQVVDILQDQVSMMTKTEKVYGNLSSSDSEDAMSSNFEHTFAR